ncbi:xanthine dehydrogenase family protein molybdopterin-binding subunit [Rhodoplanes sp. TEM]|uniref:Xanthine dehydrogenase family protein molybdopterin-binding subunit n=1 Tax=Rhodoplanes tepidamans TaxID=200616 RepID=A0ABT5J7P4_RHOTP|nr:MULTISPECIES: xanthine dehydrogenase family protein molybdopterin-binding subunit [Rhodoplanes]MDC7785606.1 xanthine dehydrogenase family protein molybdopterin-binding subunit [Rhodoplanes tepidamans]MDC7985707.1 xanthine dehydrogenase family protein molybdopterin-binding subunit [Rhodoplanes sp. TEM]MDQ0354828.1 carbon-monoxide dehydrogenase large subunit [Rhodoplanes tepidamans]
MSLTSAPPALAAVTAPRPGCIGDRVLRNEDGRFLAGHGEYLADLDVPGTREIAFLRSPVAHARIRAIAIPEGAEGRVFLLKDLGDIHPVRAVLTSPGFRGSDYPALAADTVRFVGEPIAICLGATRAEAEDLAQEIVVDFDELPPVVEIEQALDPASPSLHGWPDNICFVSTPGGGDLDAAAKAAAVTVSREFRMARQCVVSLEGRGVMAWWDRRLQELVVYSSTQQPHVIRTVLAKLIGVPEHQLRVVAPDVGGGFGVKNNLQQEEVAIAALARRLKFPIRWTEDRREHLIASPQAREHRVRLTAHADAQGRILGLEAEAVVNAGAYSIWPWSAAMEANMVAGILTGPYAIEAYRGRGVTVVSNKAPLGPYRGVGRPSACFTLERLVDEIARAVGREPHAVRIDNMVRPEQMPYRTVTGKLFDSGDYAESVRQAAAMIDVPAVRARQTRENGKGPRFIGLGFASYTEQTAHGTDEWIARGLTEVFGYETATVRFTPDGKLIIEAAIQNHGQGLETTLAQVAAEELGVDPADVVVRHGDTAVSPYGMGTFASRSMVMAGGAVGRASRQLAEKVKRIAAHLLQVKPDEVTLAGNCAVAGARSVPLKSVTDAAFLHPENLPAGEEPCLDETTTFQPLSGTGAFAYATHAVVVAVDTGTGLVEILEYAVAHDCGTMVNPMIVEGQVQGGVAQGIGNALLEESPYDSGGQPLASTFADYLVPGAPEVPTVRIAHLETPSPFTAYGIKGMGEGGAIAAPAAILNAVNDALRPLGVELNETPITPKRILTALHDARTERAR